jgi:hypothetical protein
VCWKELHSHFWHGRKAHTLQKFQQFKKKLSNALTSLSTKLIGGGLGQSWVGI